VTDGRSLIQSKHDTREAELRVTSPRKSEDVSSLVVLPVRAVGGPIPMAEFVVEYEADAEGILGRILSADQNLGLLRAPVRVPRTHRKHRGRSPAPRPLRCQ